DGIIQRVIVMPPGAPQAAVDALRTAITRVNGDAAYADEAEKTFGFVPQWAAGPDTPEVAQSALTVPPQVRAFLIDYMKNLPKYGRRVGALALGARLRNYRRACVCTLSVTGVPARTASSPRRSAGTRSPGFSTFSPRPPQVSITFS